MTEWSRFKWSTVETDEAGRRYLGERPVFGYRDLPDNRLHIVKEGERVWHVCHIFFPRLPKNGTLYWIVCDFQPEPILDPTLELEVGRLLVIPSQETVQRVILARGES